MQEVSLKNIKKTGDKLDLEIYYLPLVIVFTYIDKHNYWVMDFYTSSNSEEPFLSGVKCKCNEDLLLYFLGILPGVPLASLQFISNSNKQYIEGDDMANGDTTLCILLKEEIV